MAHQVGWLTQTLEGPQVGMWLWFFFGMGCHVGDWAQPLDEAVREGNIQGGQIVLMAAFGAGLTWAASVARW